MAITSIGYDGQINETKVEQWFGYSTAAKYGVNSPDSFAATTVAGQALQVRIKGGTPESPAVAWTSGLVDFMDADHTIQLDAVTSGSRWDLIVMRREYLPPTGNSYLAVIKGSGSKVLPARNTQGGVLEDQPLWLVKVTAGSSVVTEYVDLRVFARNGGATANDDLVRSYLSSVGTMIEINGILWLRRSGSNNAAEWVRLSGQTTHYDAAAAFDGWEARGKVAVTLGVHKRVDVNIAAIRTSLESYTPSYGWRGIGYSIPTAARGKASHLTNFIGGRAPLMHTTVDEYDGAVDWRIEPETGAIQWRMTNPDPGGSARFNWPRSGYININVTYFL